MLDIIVNSDNIRISPDDLRDPKRCSSDRLTFQFLDHEKPPLRFIVCVMRKKAEIILCVGKVESHSDLLAPLYEGATEDPLCVGGGFALSVVLTDLQDQKALVLGGKSTEFDTVPEVLFQRIIPSLHSLLSEQGIFDGVIITCSNTKIWRNNQYWDNEYGQALLASLSAEKQK